MGNEQDDRHKRIGELSENHKILVGEITDLDKKIETDVDKVRECAKHSGFSSAVRENFKKYPYPDHSYIAEKIAQRREKYSQLEEIEKEMKSLGVNAPARPGLLDD